MPAYNFLVSRVYPANKETDVSLDTKIYIVFDRFMDESTLNRKNIRIYDANGEEISWRYVGYVNNKFTFIIEPEDLQPETEYKIVVAGTHKGVKSLATNFYLAADKHYFFTTGQAEEVESPEPDIPEEPGDGEDPKPEPPKPEPQPPIEDIFGSLQLQETYPADGAVHITPERVMALFRQQLDSNTVTPETAYIVRAKNKQKLSTLDLMTDYAPNKRIMEAVVSVTDNIITIDADLADDAEYTVVIRNTIKDVSGNHLSANTSWSFMTKFPYLYGDAELIRNDLSVFMSGIPDRILYKMMRDNSEYAYEIATASGTMPPTTAEGAPLHVHQYVRYKTAYDLLVNGQIRESSSSGSSIRLGDLTVDKTGESSDMTAISKDFKTQIRIWEDAIRGHNNRGYARTLSVVKGENVAPYPEFLTRGEFSELGE